MSQENDSKKSADIPPQYRLVPDAKQAETQKMADLYPGMRSPQSIVEERIINKDTSKNPIYETPEDKKRVDLYPGMRSPKNLQDEQVALGVVEKNTSENLSQMAEQRRIIRQEQERESARMAAQIEQRRRSFNRGQLRQSEMDSVIERMKRGGGIQVPTFEENDRILREDESVLLEEVGGITGMVGKLNKVARREVNAPEIKVLPNKELLQTAVAVPDELRKPVDQKKVTELVTEATARPTEAMITKVAEVNQYLNENLATKTPTEILQHLQLDKFLKAEDIQIATQDGPRIDPVKRDYILNAVRLRLATEAASTKGVGQMNEEIGTKYKASREAADKIRAAIKKNTPATADEAADKKYRSYVELFKKRVQEEMTRARGSGRAFQSDEAFRLPIAQEIVGQLQSVLPDVTAEEFLAAVSVLESQENVQKASQDFQKKVFEQYNAEHKKGKLLEVPVKVKFKREDIESNDELLNLLRQISGHEPRELQEILAEVTAYSGNLLNAIKHFGLENILKPSYVRTEGDMELVDALDTDDYGLFNDAIRMKYILEKQLYKKVDIAVNEQLKSEGSANMLSYRRLYDFSASRFPDAPEESKHLLEHYRSEFQQMVDRELHRHNAISKALGKAKATILPGDTYLANARHKAAEEFVRTKQNELPPGMSADQFLAAMTIADTYKTAEDQYKKEVIEWYSKWYKKNVPAENNAGGAPGGERRRRIPNPVSALSNLRRIRPSEPPAQPPPAGPGNGLDNPPPGGNPPPEPPPNPPGNGGGAAGGAPSPDNPPPTEPPDDAEDTVEVIVPELPPHSDPAPAAGTGEPPTQNTVENEQPAAPARRSIRNELTPRKLSEQAVKLYKKSKERAQKAVKLAYEGSPYELTEGLLRSAVKIQDVETAQLIEDDDFLNKLNDYRGTEGEDIRSKVEDMDGEDILATWGLEGHFDANSVKDRGNRNQLLDAIYIREISLAIFQANEEAFQDEIKKVSPQSLEQVQKFSHTVTEFLPQYLDDVANFQMDMLGRKMNLNPITASQYMNQERLKIATKIFEENKFMMPEGATPEQFLAALSVVETVYQISNGIFNDLYEVYEQKENPEHDQSIAGGQRGGENRPLQERKKRRNVLDLVTGKGERPAVFLKSNNLLITGPRVENVYTNDLIKVNDVVNISLPKFRAAEQDRIKRMEIEGRDLNDIVTKWRLRTLFSESYVAGDNEKIRDSQALVDAIILRDISREYFERFKPTFDAQLETIVPKKSLEQYQAHEEEVLKLYPEFQQRFQNQFREMIRTRLPSDSDSESRRKAYISARNIAAKEIFERNQSDMPEGSTPEKFLAALSLQETYIQIQDKLFHDLYAAYVNSSPSDNDGSNNPPNEPPPPSRGGGPPRTTPPSPSSTPDSSSQTRGGIYDLQPGENPDTTLVNQTGPASFHTVVDKNGFLQADPLKNLQDRIRNLADSKN